MAIGDGGLRVISSVHTFIYKNVLPATLFLVLGGIAAGVVTSAGQPKAAPLPFALVPIMMMGFFYIILKFTVFDLMDEVQDGGNYLTLRFKSEEDRIDISNIINVNYAQFQNPRRATLLLRDPCKFGKEVAFIPLLPFSGLIESLHFRNAIVDDVRARMDAARRN